MDLKPGSRWKSAVCETQLVVVRPPSLPVTLACGGQPMTPHDAERAAALTPAPDLAGGSLLGKRYVDEPSKLEVLCTKSGIGSVTVDGRPIGVKQTKKLPSSD